MIQLKPRTDTFVVFSLEHNTILAKHGIFQNKQYCDEDTRNADSVNCYKKCLLDKNVPKEVFHLLSFMEYCQAPGSVPSPYMVLTCSPTFFITILRQWYLFEISWNTVIFLDASASLGLGVSPIYQCWNKSLILHISYYIFMQHIHATFLY